MSLAVLTIRREPYYRRAAFEQGLKKLGYTIAGTAAPGPWAHAGRVDARPQSREDFLILWNLKRGQDENSARLWEQQGGTVLVCENGYLQRVDKTYYAISVHGHNGSGWFPVDQTEDRFSKLGFEIKPFYRGTDVHLVCGQRGVGSSMMASPPMWGERMAKDLERRYGKGKVLLRSHPGNQAPRVPLEEDLRKCGKVHIWSSGAGVRALVEGHEVLHYAPRWICAGPGTVAEQLNHMAHGQWHHEEIATGEPFARIVARIGEAKW